MKENNNLKSKNLFESFKHAIDGIIYTLRKEKNMRFHFLAMFIVIIFGFILKISVSEWEICLVLFATVMGSELFNTAIENVVNLLEPKYNEYAKKAKDISAGAVLVFAFFALVIGVLIFLPKLVLLIK